MTDIVKGMARAYVDAWDLLGAELEPSDRMRAALLWLADNVSDEMVFASIALENDPRIDELRKAFKTPKHAETVAKTKACIQRAIRRAAE